MVQADGGRRGVMRTNQHGFTIVELLIVIVVIAVLAAITVVTYSGITQRASNAQRIAAAEQWIKSIKAYVYANGSYPLTGSQIFCIGTNNPTDLDVNPDVDCGLTGNVKHDSVGTPTFNQAIATISTLPKFPSKSVDFGSYLTAGLLYRATDIYDPTGQNIPTYPTLIYALDGANQDCELGPLVVPFGGGNFVTTTAKNSATSGNGTGCRVMLDDPS